MRMPLARGRRSGDRHHAAGPSVRSDPCPHVLTIPFHCSILPEAEAVHLRQPRRRGDDTGRAARSALSLYVATDERVGVEHPADEPRPARGTAPLGALEGDAAVIIFLAPTGVTQEALKAAAASRRGPAAACADRNGRPPASCPATARPPRAG